MCLSFCCLSRIGISLTTVGVDNPSGSNYAFGVPSFTSDCLRGFGKLPHYRVLFECDSNNRRVYNVPCLFSTFCLLLADCSSLVMQGDVMKRLQVAMQYNVKKKTKHCRLSVGAKFLLFYRLPRLADFSTQFKAHLLQPCTEYWTFSKTDTDAFTLLIYLFLLTISKLCKACIVFEEENVA